MVNCIKNEINYANIAFKYNIPKPELSIISKDKVHLICEYIENRILNTNISNRLNVPIMTSTS